MGETINITYKPTKSLKPYENNPRKNEKAVEAVAASIKEFGFKSPIVVDKDNVIIAGHTRLKAAEKLGLETVPVIMADELTEEQVKAYRLADNKTAELAEWNFELLDSELAEICKVDMSAFGFDAMTFSGIDGESFFQREERNDAERQEGNDEYNEFLDKFETKKTTDDCYTPDGVYKVVADYVAEQYGLKQENFVRPFYPGGDYQSYKYRADAVVVDNPPFSIFREIVDFYTENKIRFFLFAPCLALFNYIDTATAICIQAAVEYENGAKVPTSFLTNLEPEDIAARTAPDLYQNIKQAVEDYRKEHTKEIPKYKYPDEIATAAMLGYMSHHDEELTIKRSESESISALDEQREFGKAIYGKGLILSKSAAAEKAAAEKAAAEKAAAEKAAAQTWTLSEREHEIVRRLSNGK